MAPSLLTRLRILLLALHLVSAQEGNNQFVYNGFTGSNLTTNGMASIHPNGLLELTNTSKQQIGHAFFPFSIDLNSSSLSFSTTFVFAMVPETPTLGGHGIAFVISPTPHFEGAIATQYLGLFNSTTIGLQSNHVIAVELDTVQNPEFGDINSNHVGIDINNLTSIQSANAAYFTEGEEKELELISGDPIQVWIDYTASNKELNVTLAPVRTSKPAKPLLSTTDLKIDVLDRMYVGFSSSTGSIASHHYILGWSLDLTGSQARDLDISNLPSLPPERNSGNRSSANLKILLPVVITILLITSIALTVYFTRKRYEELHEDWEEQYGPQRFSYRDLGC